MDRRTSHRAEDRECLPRHDPVRPQLACGTRQRPVPGLRQTFRAGTRTHNHRGLAARRSGRGDATLGS